MQKTPQSSSERFSVSVRVIGLSSAIILFGVLSANSGEAIRACSVLVFGVAALSAALWWATHLSQRPGTLAVMAGPHRPWARTKPDLGTTADTAVIRRQASEPIPRHRLQRADWFQFEQVVAAISAADGYSVERLGAPHMDGGVDLLLTRGNETIALKCQPWRKDPVGAGEVQDLRGCMLAIKAVRGVLVAVAGFSPAAREFAREHSIKLIGEREFLTRLEQLQHTTRWPLIDGCLDSLDRCCPRCESPMVEKRADLVGLTFLACARSPRCDYVEPPIRRPHVPAA